MNLAYRWFCKLSITDKVPDHSTFSKNRHGRLRESEVFRFVFEQVLTRCMEEGLIGGEGFAVDASVVKADASKQKHHEDDDDDWGGGSRAINEYLDAIEADGSSTSPARQVSQADSYTCPNGKQLKRYRRNFKKPRTGITKSNEIKYRASKLDCTTCPMKAQCCPNTEIRKVTRSVHESARDVARAVRKTPAYRRTRRQRKQVEMLFALMKRILKLDRLRLRGLSGAGDEFLLTTTAQNLRRMAKLLGTGPPGNRKMAVA